LPALLLFSSSRGALRELLSFPTRRSSDLNRLVHAAPSFVIARTARKNARIFSGSFSPGAFSTPDDTSTPEGLARRSAEAMFPALDRKSTRLNSSHVKISYAVFCLKKKNKK